MEEIREEVNIYDLIDCDLVMLTEELEKVVPGSEESERIHKQKIETLKLKNELIKLELEDSRANKREKTEKARFIVQTATGLLSIVVPAGISLGLIRLSQTGGYMTGDESKALGWLFTLMGKRNV